MRLLVKLSGKVLEEAASRRTLAQELAALHGSGHRLTVVHGGGPQLTDFCRRLGIPVRQVQGRRVTDAATLDAAVKVFSQLNAELTAALAAAGVPAVGLAAFSGGLTHAERRAPLRIEENGRVATVDFGFVGDLRGVRPHLALLLWTQGFVPVISSLCADEAGNLLNINADTLAVELAVALQADRLIAVSDVDGVYLDLADPASRLSSLSASEARRLLAEGILKDGMIPKIQNALRALEAGLPAFQIVQGDRPDHLRRCLDAPLGTVLTADPAALR
ncbi:MAG: acetylglutamate kinase [Acidobacteriota bacterium]